MLKKRLCQKELEDLISHQNKRGKRDKAMGWHRPAGRKERDRDFTNCIKRDREERELDQSHSSEIQNALKRMVK